MRMHMQHAHARWSGRGGRRHTSGMGGSYQARTMGLLTYYGHTYTLHLLQALHLGDEVHEQVHALAPHEPHHHDDVDRALWAHVVRVGRELPW